MFVSMGLNGLLGVTISILFIFLSWWALQVFRIDIFFTDPNSPQAKLLLVFLSILIGYGLTSFFLDYLSWSVLIRQLF